MAEIDHTIYYQMQTPDLVGSFEKGMKLSDLMKKRKQDSDEQEAMKGSFTTGGDGSISLNNKSLSKLAKLNPEKALELKSKFGEVDSNERKRKLEISRMQAEDVAQEFSGVRDQATYERALQNLRQRGHNVDQEPAQYDRNYIQTGIMKVLSVKDRLDHELKQQNYKLDERRVRVQERDTAKESGDSKNYVPGVGIALNADDAKTLKGAKEMKSKFDRQINELIELRGGKMNPETGKREGGYGVEYINRNAVDRGKQLSKDLLLTYKNLSKLGVLSKADEEIVNAIIPQDPLGQDWAVGQDPILHRLEKFKGDLDEDYEMTLATRLKSREGKSPGGERSIVKTQTNRATGEKRIIYSDGTIENINPVAGR